MTEGIRTINLDPGTLIEIIGHEDAGGGQKNLVRMDLDDFRAAFITPSLVPGPFGTKEDFLSGGLVTEAKKNRILALPADGSQVTVQIDAPSNLSSDYAVQVWNPPHDGTGAEHVRRHRVISQFTDFFLAPGHTCEFRMHAGAVTRKDAPVKWQKQSFVMYANSAATQTYFDGMVAGTGSAKKTLLACIQTCLRDIEHQGSNPKIVPVGSFDESLTLSGSIGTGTLIYIEAANPNTFTWRNGATPFAMQAANGGTFIIHNVDFARQTLPNVIFISSHQKGVVDVGDPNIGTGQVITFADAGATGSCIATDGAGNTININCGLIIKAGSYGNFVYISGASSLNWTGGTTVTLTGSPTIGTFMQLAGSGANAALAPGITFVGTPAVGCTKYTVSLNATLSLSGNTLPGSVAGSFTAGGQVV